MSIWHQNPFSYFLMGLNVGWQRRSQSNAGPPVGFRWPGDMVSASSSGPLHSHATGYLDRLDCRQSFCGPCSSGGRHRDSARSEAGRRAGKLSHALYGADSLIEHMGSPTKSAELSQFAFCALSERLKHYTAVRWARGTAAMSMTKVPLIFNTEAALAAAIAAGAGLGIFPCVIGGKLKGVRRLTGISIGGPVDIWLVTHRALRGNAQVGELMRHLVAAFKNDAHSFV